MIVDNSFLSITCPTRYHLPRKRLTPPRTRHYRLPHPQNTPEQTREKTPIIRSRTKLRMNMFTKSSFEGKPLTDTSPGTIPRICSPFPDLVVSSPPPFRFTQESLFFFPLRWKGFIITDKRRPGGEEVER